MTNLYIIDQATLNAITRTATDTRHEVGLMWPPLWILAGAWLLMVMLLIARSGRQDADAQVVEHTEGTGNTCN